MNMNRIAKEKMNEFTSSIIGKDIFEGNGHLNPEAVQHIIEMQPEAKKLFSPQMKNLKKLKTGDTSWVQSIGLRFSNDADTGIKVDQNGNIEATMSMEDAAVFATKIFFGEFEAISVGIDDVMVGLHDDRMSRIAGKWKTYNECLAQKQEGYLKTLENISERLNEDIEAVKLELKREIEKAKNPFENPIFMFMPGQAEKMAKNEKRAEESLAAFIRGAELKIIILLLLGYLKAAQTFMNSCVEDFNRLFDKEALEKLQSWNKDTNKGNPYRNNFWEDNTNRFCEMLMKFSRSICGENNILLSKLEA